MTDQLVEKVEQIVREVVPAKDLKIIVSNIGVTPGFSSIYTPNSGPHTAFVQVGLKAGHRLSSFEYMDLVRARLQKELPQAARLFSDRRTGGCDAESGPAGAAGHSGQRHGSGRGASDRRRTIARKGARSCRASATCWCRRTWIIRRLQLDIDRVRASELGLDEKEVVGNVITALTSDMMIAPSYWVDPKSGNDYLLTVQYPEEPVKNLAGPDVRFRCARRTFRETTRLDAVERRDAHRTRRPKWTITNCAAIMDVYVSPDGRGLGQGLERRAENRRRHQLPANMRVTMRGSAQAMQVSFRSFGLGLILATVLVYLILVAQFQSFLDPLLILLAVPTGLTGVLLMLFATGTTLNVMSLMGVVMMVGIVVSNSILIVEFTNRLRAEGRPLREAVSLACRVRLRPVLMTSLATLIGLLPMALKLGTGSEAYAPLARAIIGGLARVGGADRVHRAGGVLHHCTAGRKRKSKNPPDGTPRQFPK